MVEFKSSEFTGYSVTECGMVYSHKLKRYMSPFNNGLGYMAVKLRDVKGERRTVYVHRLVASCYLSNPQNFCEVNHKDGIKSNNHYSNLEWCSKSFNLKHAFENKLLKGFISKKYK